MDMTISKKDRALLIALAGVLVAATTYWFIYVGFSEKTTALETENATLQTRVNTLQDLVNQQEILKENTIANTNEAQAIMNRFPADVREEDLIMLAVNLQNYAPFGTVDSVTIDEPEQLYQFADVGAKTESIVRGKLPLENVIQAAVTDSATDSTTDAADGVQTEVVPAQTSTPVAANTPVLYKRDGSIICTTTYEGLKRAVSYVLERNDRTGIAVTATYDITTGILLAGIKVAPCYITGTDKQYIAPDIPYVQQGTDNIFGTLSFDELQNVTDDTEDAEE